MCTTNLLKQYCINYTISIELLLRRRTDRDTHVTCVVISAAKAVPRAAIRLSKLLDLKIVTGENEGFQKGACSMCRLFGGPTVVLRPGIRLGILPPTVELGLTGQTDGRTEYGRTAQALKEAILVIHVA